MSELESLLLVVQRDAECTRARTIEHSAKPAGNLSQIRPWARPSEKLAGSTNRYLALDGKVYRFWRLLTIIESSRESFVFIGLGHGVASGRVWQINVERTFIVSDDRTQLILHTLDRHRDLDRHPRFDF
jgi:hypothetical protein